MAPLTNLLISWGVTRDSFLWLGSRLVAGSLIVVSGLVPFEHYIGERATFWLRIGAVVILWLAGKYDSSPLPGKPTP